MAKTPTKQSIIVSQDKNGDTYGKRTQTDIKRSRIEDFPITDDENFIKSSSFI